MNRFESWKMMLNTTVIMRSNEDEPYKIGKLVGFDKIGNSTIPLIEVDNKRYLNIGITIPYSNEIVKFLDSLPPKKQWKILADISLAIRISHRKDK